MALNLATNLKLSYIQTVQALRESKTALGLVKKLYPTDPIRELYYQGSVDSLTSAIDGLFDLPLDIKFPSDPVIPPNPITPPIGDNQLIIKLANVQAQLAINKTVDSIKYIDQALLLVGEFDTLGGLITFIKNDLVDARNDLQAAIDLPTS